MLPSSVAKCMTTNYYAITYDHDHSKHINDHLRCRQDNGATCLNCKVDFFAGNANHRVPLLPHHSFHSPHPTFEMQAVWVSHWAHLPISHSHYLYSHTLFSISPYLSLALSVSLFTVPWYDQRQLCDTERGIQEAENIKPLKSNL